MTAGETPSCTIRRIATKNIAFTSRFASAPYAAVARKYGQPQDEADALGHVVVRLAGRTLAVRRREVGPQAAQHDPVDGERDGVEGERQPAGDGVQDAAERATDQRGDVLTGLALAERRRQLVGADDRADRGDLGRGGDAARDPGQQGDHREVGDRQHAQRPGRGERGVQHDAGAARRPHEQPPVDAVGEDARRQQGAAHAEQERRLDDGRPEGRAAEGVGDEREHEHAHVAAQVADGLARPEDGEVAVLGECAVAGHMRTIYCATIRAQ